ncbi:MAG: hypothetical protein A2888_00700 [Chlamydiae bacterium RIFCSPLOWO2_01_FULL_28_7]|nr:MAG: hypothetical protein A2888_00700 [Chlamydiae bacterium RIFCSPLOWO2_01_FULL_28_7]
MKILNEEEKIILDALRSNCELKACILEMIDITDGKSLEELKTGDDAEEAVVGVIQKTGKTILQNWIERKKIKAEKEAAANKSYRPHEKKSQMAHINR